jgi:hypothetical protein
MFSDYIPDKINQYTLTLRIFLPSASSHDSLQ